MKKSLLALAVLGAFATGAQAQTNVSIGGVVQANWKSYSIGNTARTHQTEYRIDDDYTSRFWLTGTEDLGGGLSALFYIENRLNTTDSSTIGTGNGLGNGDTFLGLKGSWGQVTVGKHSMMSVAGLTTEILAAKGVTAMPTSMFATYSILNQAAGYLDITRRANSIYYKSPIMSGFNVNVGVSTASAGNEGNAPGTTNYNDGREWFLQGGYNNGPLSVNLAYRNNTVEGRTGTDDKQWRLYGFYKLPMGLKIGLQVDRATRTPVVAGASGTSVSRTAWELPLSYNFGNNSILFSYTRAGDLGGVSNTGAKMYTLGWDYALSARTNVGVYYSKLSNDSAAAYQPFLAGTSLTGSALAAGESAQTFALGVKHTF